MSELLTIAEAAELLRVKRTTLYGSLRRKVPCVRVGRGLRYRRADLDRWLNESAQNTEHAE